MSDVRAVLSEVKAQRVEADRLYRSLRELRKPWHAPLWIAVGQLPWLYLAVNRFIADRPLSMWVLVGLGGLSLGSVVLGFRERDKMWRELIAKRSPDLDRELNRPDA